MNTASILIKTDPQLKMRAQKTAEKMGISLTSVINNYLKHFITIETVTFDTKEEKLSKWAIKTFKESEADVKAGRVIRFKNVQEELDYLDKEIEDERRRISSH